MRLIDADAFERAVMFSDDEDIQDVIYRLRDFPSAQPDLSEHSTWFRIGETLVDESKMNITAEQAVDKIRGYMIRMKKPESQWIPCSERLPENEKRTYWICTDTGYQCECRWTNVNHFWTDLTTDWHWHWMDIPQYTQVVAWMPLPPSYRGEIK